MGKIEATYGLIRFAEERTGPLLAPGQVLIYRSVSRFPWMDMIFDLPAGTRCKVRTSDCDPLVPASEHDACDNHYYYTLEGLEEDGGIVTTEIVSMFDLERCPEAIDDLAAGVTKAVLSYHGRVLGELLAEDFGIFRSN